MDTTKFQKQVKPKFYIGIDPDVDKSGFAIYDPKTKLLDLRNYDFFDLQDKLLEFKAEGIEVVIEASWLIEHNWHYQTNKRKSSSVGKDVGANHQVGKLIKLFCEKKGIPFILRKPLKKPKKNGKSVKVDQELFKKITGYTKVTNQEKRDAALLVYGM